MIKCEFGDCKDGGLTKIGFRNHFFVVCRAHKMKIHGLVAALEKEMYEHNAKALRKSYMAMEKGEKCSE